jgi:serine/threonine protein kinase
MRSFVPIRRIDGYLLGNILGKGSFGHVRIATKLGDTIPKYAVKYMKVGKLHSKETLLKSLQQELVLHKLDHPNILRIHDASSEGVYEKTNPEVVKTPVVYAVLQLARTGDLCDFVAGSGELSEKTARWFFNQILDAVEYLHFSGLAHRDIKPGNILLSQNYHPLLTDFGMSSSLSDVGFITEDPRDRVGTERCMAPELFVGFKHSPVKDDLFALGYSLFILVAKHPPFFSASINDEHYKLLKDNRVLDYWRAIDSAHTQGWCSDDFKHLITLMLTYDMTVRPSVAEIRAHPWTLGELPNETEVISEFEARQLDAIEYQKKQAIARKVKKDKQREYNDRKLPEDTDEKEEQDKRKRKNKAFGARFKKPTKRGVEEEKKVSVIYAANKIIKEVDDPKECKPTILMSQESIPLIEATLMAFFSTQKCVKPKEKKYEVQIDLKVVVFGRV